MDEMVVEMAETRGRSGIVDYSNGEGGFHDHSEILGSRELFDFYLFLGI